MQFKLESQFRPAGDQPRAIEELSAGVLKGVKEQMLLGVTGSGKTYTMSEVIERVQKPTLVISHNKHWLRNWLLNSASSFRRIRLFSASYISLAGFVDDDDIQFAE
jgi:excinuclease UvrABC helicase subunit UvrB